MIDLNEIDVYAAEYVLGTLNREERVEVQKLCNSSDEWHAAIDAWQIRLASLNDLTPEVEPPAGLFHKIERRIEHLPSIPQTHLLITNRRIRQWQSLALAASIAFVLATAAAVYISGSQLSRTPSVAVLQGSAAPAFVVMLDNQKTRLTIRPVSASAPQDKSYQLWLIADGAPTPQSLGILNNDGAEFQVQNVEASVVRHSTLAISIEPQGGSPTGAPTGPVVFTGKFL